MADRQELVAAPKHGDDDDNDELQAMLERAHDASRAFHEDGGAMNNDSEAELFGSPPERSVEARLNAMFQRFVPNRQGQLVRERYTGYEEGLLLLMCAKYGPEPSTQWAAEASSRKRPKRAKPLKLTSDETRKHFHRLFSDITSIFRHDCDCPCPACDTFQSFPLLERSIRLPSNRRFKMRTINFETDEPPKGEQLGGAACFRFPDLLCLIFEWLPFSVSTLVAAGTVCKSWRYYTNFLPHWEYVLPRRSEVALIVHGLQWGKRGRFFRPIFDDFPVSGMDPMAEALGLIVPGRSQPINSSFNTLRGQHANGSNTEWSRRYLHAVEFFFDEPVNGDTRSKSLTIGINALCIMFAIGEAATQEKIADLRVMPDLRSSVFYPSASDDFKSVAVPLTGKFSRSLPRISDIIWENPFSDTVERQPSDGEPDTDVVQTSESDTDSISESKSFLQERSSRKKFQNLADFAKKNTSNITTVKVHPSGRPDVKSKTFTIRASRVRSSHDKSLEFRKSELFRTRSDFIDGVRVCLSCEKRCASSERWYQRRVHTHIAILLLILLVGVAGKLSWIFLSHMSTLFAVLVQLSAVGGIALLAAPTILCRATGNVNNPSTKLRYKRHNMSLLGFLLVYGGVSAAFITGMNWTLAFAYTDARAVLSRGTVQASELFIDASTASHQKNSSFSDHDNATVLLLPTRVTSVSFIEFPPGTVLSHISAFQEGIHLPCSHLGHDFSATDEVALRNTSSCIVQLTNGTKHTLRTAEISLVSVVLPYGTSVQNFTIAVLGNFPGMPFWAPFPLCEINSTWSIGNRTHNRTDNCPNMTQFSSGVSSTFLPVLEAVDQSSAQCSKDDISQVPCSVRVRGSTNNTRFFLRRPQPASAVGAFANEDGPLDMWYSSSPWLEYGICAFNAAWFRLYARSVSSWEMHSGWPAFEVEEAASPFLTSHNNASSASRVLSSATPDGLRTLVALLEAAHKSCFYLSCVMVVPLLAVLFLTMNRSDSGFIVAINALSLFVLIFPLAIFLFVCATLGLAQRAIQTELLRREFIAHSWWVIWNPGGAGVAVAFSSAYILFILWMISMFIRHK